MPPPIELKGRRHVAIGNARINAILDRVQKVTRRTTQNLKRELSLIDSERMRITSRLDDAARAIREMLGKLGGGVANGRGPGRPPGRGPGRPPGSASTGRKRKRIRRSPQQLKLEAQAILEFIRGKGASGASGSEIRKQHPKVGPDIKGFVQKWGSKKLRTSG